ncbi:MAG: arginyl-tRNA--protein arginylyltransferase [Cyclobacteriaceae bacterium]|nr:arginyl-tRNA--protein arginylyltransferase [Cyclobacteriaceae bacterium]
MFAEAQSPTHITASELDDYLERGWFRMGQTIFTTQFIHFQSVMYNTIWLRVALESYQADRAQVKLFKQNARFTTLVQPATITDEKEDLYSRYRESVAFQPSESLEQLLYGSSEEASVFNTYEVLVYDSGKLVALGYFDLGQTSAEGIVSIYDPSYKKYSLGKFLIYKKMEYCKALGMHYYYPGYFVPGYSFFNYKLSIATDSLSFFSLPIKQWIPIQQFDEALTPLGLMKSKLLEVKINLDHLQQAANVVNYEFFDANLIPDLRTADLFDYPVFLYSPSIDDNGIYLVMVYDIYESRYHVLACMGVWQPQSNNTDPTFFSECILKVLQPIYTTISASEAAIALLTMANR